MRQRRLGKAFALLLVLDAAGACGSRTGLGIEEEFAPPDGGGQDAASDQFVNPRQEDVVATFDVVRADRSADVTDAIPPIDGRPINDVRRDDCPDADATLIYVVSSTNDLLSFYPPSATFTTIGKIACPSGGANPFSMGVDRKGKAYVVFTDGHLFQVSTATAACVATPFVVGQHGFKTFGMGFVSDTGGPQETLYVAENDLSRPLSNGLATIDTTTFNLNFISDFRPKQPRLELTGTGDGRLFGYAPTPNGTGSNIVEIDKTTAAIVGEDVVPFGSSVEAFAFAFWGGDFYVFHGVGSTTVSRFRPTDKTSVTITTAPVEIVGAGVSTCAPQ